MWLSNIWVEEGCSCAKMAIQDTPYCQRILFSVDQHACFVEKSNTIAVAALFCELFFHITHSVQSSVDIQASPIIPTSRGHPSFKLLSGIVEQYTTLSLARYSSCSSTDCTIVWTAALSVLFHISLNWGFTTTSLSELLDYFHDTIYLINYQLLQKFDSQAIHFDIIIYFPWTIGQCCGSAEVLIL